MTDIQTVRKIGEVEEQVVALKNLLEETTWWERKGFMWYVKQQIERSEAKVEEQAAKDRQVIEALQEQMTHVQTVLNAMQAQNAQAPDALQEAVAARPAGGACPRSFMDPQGIERMLAQQTCLLAQLATAVAALPAALAQGRGETYGSRKSEGYCRSCEKWGHMVKHCREAKARTRAKEATSAAQRLRRGTGPRLRRRTGQSR